MIRRLAAAALATALVLGACSDDEPDAQAPPADEPVGTITTQAPESGDIDVPEVPDTFPVAVPSLGFGVAVPEGWQATLLSEEALERLDGARLAQPFFLEAARNAASTGAILYAAGIDRAGQVADLKVDVQVDADTSPEALADLVDAVLADPTVRDAVVDEDRSDGWARIDFEVELPAADDGALIEARATQLFVPDGDRLWSLVVTSEDPATQQALLEVFEASFVVSGS